MSTGICNIKHPLRGEPGSSQLKRNTNALQAADVSIDGRSLADILNYLYRYSRQVNFQDYFPHGDEGEYTLSNDWSAFFEKSTPLLLARISKIDTELIGQDYLLLRRDFDRMPSSATFNQLMDYCYEEAIQPLYTWFETLKREERYQREAAGVLPDMADSEFRFKRRLADLVSAELAEPLKEFITIYQKANTHQVVTQRNFFPFLNQQIWGLKITDLVKPVKYPYLNREELVKTLDETVFSKFQNILRQISQFAPDYISESLYPLQEAFRKQHEPHLALLFTFLELFKYVQGDMNRLSEKHLDFFFKQVLRVKPKPHRPDQAHLVFEVAKQLEQYLIKGGTLFKDGKDANKADLVYSLDDEIVIDKATIERLMTLYLKQSRVDAKPQKLVPAKDENGNEIEDESKLECIAPTIVALEGVYMAPVANSADGLGLKFPENQIPNWATLGAKESKINAPGKTTPGQYPYARLGLVLASPVLLLNEGRREVVITVCCDFNGNESIADVCLFFNKLDRALKQPYYKLTESFLQKLPTFFSKDAFSKLTGFPDTTIFADDLTALQIETGIENYINDQAQNFTFEEKALLICYLKCNFKRWKEKYTSEPNSKYLQSTGWKELKKNLENPLSDTARSYLISLLASQTPYIFGYDLEACLDVKEEPSCKPLFSKCEKELLKTLMDREERGMCYLDCCGFNKLKSTIIDKLKKYFRTQFPEDNPKKCLPVYLDIEELKKLKNKNTPVFNALEIDKIAQHLICDNIFKVSLSGKEGWHKPKRVKTEIVLHNSLLPDFDEYKKCEKFSFCPDSYTGDCGKVQFKITIALDETEPPIVCFDKEILKEDYDLDKPLPVVKIELNNELKLDFKDQECKCCEIPAENTCCLARDDESLEGKISLYHFFRDLQVIDTKIDVKVCGIKKNIIVQNDENILDVNSPFQPFGVRPVIVDSGRKKDDPPPPKPSTNPTPKGCPDPPNETTINLVGPNFYLGSNEIFHKCWKEVCVHLNWKDKPGSLADYYAAFDSTLDEDSFEVNISVLESGKWVGEQPRSQDLDKVCCPDKDFASTLDNMHLKSKAYQNEYTLHYNRALFDKKGNRCACECPKDLPQYAAPFPYEQTIKIESRYFQIDKEIKKNVCPALGPFLADSPSGFIKFTLENQDFFHNQYAVTLAKQMMALFDIVPGAVFKIPALAPYLGDDEFTYEELLEAIRNLMIQYSNASQGNINIDFNNFISGLTPIVDFLPSGPSPNDPIWLNEVQNDLNALQASVNNTFDNNLEGNINSIFQSIIDAFDKGKAVLIPNEPWTPTIKNIALDYSACATKDDIDLIHLYPFEGTYKHEDLEALPTLLPVFNEEGTLYLGLNNLRPGSTLNLLLQLAEATADSERDRALVHWHYLANNQWLSLRPGFEIISDETKGLTVSGIVKIAVPRGISRTGNTVMPPNLFWIKASVSELDASIQCEINDQALAPINKVKAVSETIAVHTQAARVTFKPDSSNDLQRLDSTLPASSITKMVEPEAGVKKMEQPYPSFNGKAPEASGSFYNRVSEQLRHKGRAIAGFDYEALVLEAFQQIYKVKCISHGFGLSAGDYKMDLELAPGFVTLAVIPDLTRLTAGQGLEPRAPVSVLEEIKAFLKKRVSPFVRLKVLNPRYEKVNVKAHVRLRKGKDKAYYGAKLKEDLTFFFAPWFISKDSYKLVFGQPVNESEVIKFIEKLDYVDFITCLSLSTEEAPEKVLEVVEPKTARSILTAGEICIFVNDEDCDAFSKTPSTCTNINPRGETRAYPFHSVCEKKEELTCPPITVGS